MFFADTFWKLPLEWIHTILEWIHSWSEWIHSGIGLTIPYSTVLYCTVPYITILYSTILYCTLPNSTVLYYISDYQITLNAWYFTKSVLEKLRIILNKKFFWGLIVFIKDVVFWNFFCFSILKYEVLAEYEFIPMLKEFTPHLPIFRCPKVKFLKLKS